MDTYYLKNKYKLICGPQLPFGKQAGSIFGSGYEINDKTGYGSENNLFVSTTLNLIGINARSLVEF